MRDATAPPRLEPLSDTPALGPEGDDEGNIDVVRNKQRKAGENEFARFSSQNFGLDIRPGPVWALYFSPSSPRGRNTVGRDGDLGPLPGGHRTVCGPMIGPLLAHFPKLPTPEPPGPGPLGSP